MCLEDPRYKVVGTKAHYSRPTPKCMSVYGSAPAGVSVEDTVTAIQEADRFPISQMHEVGLHRSTLRRFFKNSSSASHTQSGLLYVDPAL